MNLKYTQPKQDVKPRIWLSIQHKTIRTRFIFKGIEFDAFKIWII